MIYTLTFCCVSPETRDYAPLVDQFGNDITMKVEAESKTAAIHYDAYVENFCRDQGNDCRVRGVC